MQNVPKIVSDRLRAVRAAVGHPDPNVLTAFAERGLPESERALVMEHLARCDDCRDVIALALPEFETVETESPVTARAGWQRWTALRWGLVAASVLAVASVGIVQYRRIHRPPTMAAMVQPRNEVAAFKAQSSPAVPEAVAPQEHDREETPAVSNAKTGPAEIRRDLGGVANAQPQQGGRMGSVGIIGGAVGGIASASHFEKGPKLAVNEPPKEFAFSQGLKASAPPPAAAKQAVVAELSSRPAPGAYSQTVEVQSGTAQVNTQNQTQDQLAQNDLDAFTQQQIPSEKVDKAKPVVAQNVPGAGTALATPSEPPLPASSRLRVAGEPAARWNIASDGGLQRSLDEGKTWQDVHVSSSPAAVASSMQLRDARDVKAAKSKEKKEPTSASSNPVFRAVVAAGIEVWAGGSGGILYHSLDAGGHWTPIIPSVAGVVLTGDITSVEFSDPKHGRVTTSTSEVWTTADGGTSWQKQ